MYINPHATLPVIHKLPAVVHNDHQCFPQKCLFLRKFPPVVNKLMWVRFLKIFLESWRQRQRPTVPFGRWFSQKAEGFFWPPMGKKSSRKSGVDNYYGP